MKTKLLAAAALLLLSASAVMADANPPVPPTVTGWSGCLLAPGRNQSSVTFRGGDPAFIGNGGNYGSIDYSSDNPYAATVNSDPYAAISGYWTSSFGYNSGGGFSSCKNAVEFATTASVNTTINNLYEDIKNIQNGGTIAITPTNVTNYNGGGTQSGGALTGAATQAAIISGVARAQTSVSGGSNDVSSVSLLVPH